MENKDMKNNEIKEIEEIFEKLIEWQKLPKYSLERRLDIFFAIYLNKILEDIIDDYTDKNIIPEFPLQPLKADDSKRSVNADYAIFSKNGLYLIELKTDMCSIDNTQIQYYQKTQKDGFDKLLEFINKISKPSGNVIRDEKYIFLKEKLKETCFFDEDDYGNIKLNNKIAKKINLIYVIPRQLEKPYEINEKYIRKRECSEFLNSEEVIVITFEEILNKLPENMENKVLSEFRDILIKLQN